MYRSRIHIQARAVQAISRSQSGLASRTFTTVPPPASGQTAQSPTPKKSGGNTLLYVTLGSVALGSAYYYLSQDGEISHEKIKADEEALKHKTREAIDAAKDKSTDLGRRVKEDSEQLKGKVTDLKSPVESFASDLRRKSLEEYQSAKGGASGSLNRVRNSTENFYQEARSSAEHKAHEVREAAEKKAEDAKRGWFSWLGWGRNKADQGQERIATEVDKLKKEAGKN